MKRLALTLVVLALAACGGAPTKKPPLSSMPVRGNPPAAAGHAPTQALPAGCNGSPYARAQEDPRKRGNYTAGGLYAPGVRDSTPDAIDVSCIPEPLITDETPSAIGNRSPYTVLGKRYTVLDRPDGYVERGIASYYGSKFHGRMTSNQEVYDMYAFSAAHRRLPLPSFARVTNLDNGESIVVRVNDRGPFHDGRIIDLSYAAAARLGIYPNGTGRVEVRALTLRDNDPAVVASRQQQRDARGRQTAPATTPDSQPDPIAEIAAAANRRAATPAPAPASTTATAAATSAPVAVRADPIAAIAASSRYSTTPSTATALQATAPAATVAPVRPDPIASIAAPANTRDANAPMTVRVTTATPAAAGRGALSGTTRLATTQQPITSARTPQLTRYVASTAMDQWVGTLPVEASTPSAAATTPAPETRVITQSTGFSGRFGDDAGSAPAAAGAPPPATTGAAGSGQSKWLQIGSFASLENARRAMAQLSSAGIVGATLSDVESAGRTMWRLRVQSEESDVTELVRRLASLGFNQAQVVRE